MDLGLGRSNGGPVVWWTPCPRWTLSVGSRLGCGGQCQWSVLGLTVDDWVARGVVR